VTSKLTEIVTSVEKVTAIVGEIAASAREQSRALDAVNVAVAGIDTVTQQNAASAEQASAAASELNGQAEELASMVGEFQIERAGTRRGRHAVPARPGLRVLPEPPPEPRAAPSKPAAPARKAAPRPPGADPFPMDDDAGLADF
jgi:methyl-accepting chemotaxis protein